MNKTNTVIIVLSVIIVALIGYILFSNNKKQVALEPQLQQVVNQTQTLSYDTDTKTGLNYPKGFSIERQNENVPVSFMKREPNFEGVMIESKYENDPGCVEFSKLPEAFGFCVKGYRGEASSDELANIFIELNK